jgi:hypothetical protein
MYFENFFMFFILIFLLNKSIFETKLERSNPECPKSLKIRGATRLRRRSFT